jgi:hypothetical protein
MPAEELCRQQELERVGHLVDFHSTGLGVTAKPWTLVDLTAKIQTEEIEDCANSPRYDNNMEDI